MQRTLKTNEMNPDGVLVAIDLTLLFRGSSFFVPCLNIVGAKKQALDIGRWNGLTLKPYTVIEEGLLGIRVWCAS